MQNGKHDIATRFSPTERVVLYPGDCADLLKDIPRESVKLVVTSPPYNIGKEYESRLDLETYLRQQKEVIRECARVLSPNGSICWQVGNFVDNGSIVPLDIALYPVFAEMGFKMRNRIVWHFEHGLHCSRRFSGRYETIVWFTKGEDFTFNLDPIRVPQKYPGKKHFKGPKAGQYSCNPLGKNPGDVWGDIKQLTYKSKELISRELLNTIQKPKKLIERLVKASSNMGDLVLDPFAGAGTTLEVCLENGRNFIGIEINKHYVDLIEKRIKRVEEELSGTLFHTLG